jgi:hypothetical protein
MPLNLIVSEINSELKLDRAGKADEKEVDEEANMYVIGNSKLI